MSDKKPEPKPCGRCNGTGTYEASVLTDRDGKPEFKTVTMSCSH